MSTETQTDFVSRSEFDTLMKSFKKLQKQMRKVMKQVKHIEVPEEDKVEKKPSGFAKPTKISAELAKFLCMSEDEEIARTEVTKRINKYVKEHGLQNQENKRVIILDDTLKKLINPPDDVQLTFFNLQRYIKHHYVAFLKPAPEESSSSEAAVAETPKKVVKKRVKK